MMSEVVSVAKNWLNFEYLQPESLADPSYNIWLKENFPRKADLFRMAETWPGFTYQPLISIITPVYNPDPSFLRQAIESVMAQIYPKWELCLADDASTKPYVREILQEYAKQDARIKVVFREANGHISACSNSALELATGEFIALLDHDDLLTPDALYEVVCLLNQHPEADMIYSDEDKIDNHGKLKEPFFKPDWSPDSFISRMYTCHFGVYRRDLVSKIGGFRVGYEGSQDYDLVLRFTEITDHIFHVSKILYHWRIHELSVAGGGEAKPYAFEAAVKALNDTLTRRDIGKVKQVAAFLGAYIPRYQISKGQTVSIILTLQNFQNSLHTVQQQLELLCSNIPHLVLEVILVTKKLVQPNAPDLSSCLLQEVMGRVKYIAVDSNVPLATALNQAVQLCQGDYLLFLRNVIEPITSDWLEALLEQAQRQSIGCASGLLIDPDHKIYHAGIILEGNNIAKYVYQKTPVSDFGYFGQLISVNNYSALTGACLMCQRSKFEQVGGFTEAAASFYDIDFCLKLGEKGFRHVFLPHVKLKCHVAMDIPASDQAGKEYMQEQWQHLLKSDPYYNPNLSPSQPYALNVDYSQVQERQDFNQLAFRLYEMKNLLQEQQEELERLKRQLQKKNREIEQFNQELGATQERVTAMETSKFWKLRKSWFRFKCTFGLPSNE